MKRMRTLKNNVKNKKLKKPNACINWFHYIEAYHIQFANLQSQLYDILGLTRINHIKSSSQIHISKINRTVSYVGLRSSPPWSNGEREWQVLVYLISIYLTFYRKLAEV